MEIAALEECETQIKEILGAQVAYGFQRPQQRS